MYNMEWLGLGAGFQRALVTVMERAQRPLRPAAGHVVPLSLDTFIKVYYQGVLYACTVVHA